VSEEVEEEVELPAMIDSPVISIGKLSPVLGYLSQRSINLAETSFMYDPSPSPIRLSVELVESDVDHLRQSIEIS